MSRTPIALVLIAGIVGIAAQPLSAAFGESLGDSLFPGESAEPQTAAALAAADAAYDQGVKALDEARYDRALTAFAEAEKAGDRADAALYWRGYTLGKLNRKDEALKTLEQLATRFPRSRWRDEARALSAELRGGGAAGAAREPDDDLKLVALSGLIGSPAAEALPILRKILEGSGSLELKERALFILGQSGTPEARTLLVDVARGKTYPLLQENALRQLAITGGPDAQKLFDDVWASGASHEVKEQILQSWFLTSNLTRLSDVARTEKDDGLRATAIQKLGLFPTARSGEMLVSIYKAEKDDEARDAALSGLFVQSNAKALIELARSEKDPKRKAGIVQKISLLRSPEARAFILEILSK